MQPNLFNYATSELSQDAFICWLLEWAKPEYKEKDVLLNKTSNELIYKFFELSKVMVPKSINSVQIFKQYAGIDVLCVINEEYPIIIEDKTNTQNHSGQLKRYIDKIKKKYDEKKIIPIYFKTGDQDNYKEVKENGYYLLLRVDLLAILNKGLQSGIKNQIFIDYAAHLQGIEDKRNSYKYLPINKWDHDSWIGFYKELQERLGYGSWNYVANPSGGFVGFCWYWIEFNGGEMYLQIEEKKFCFKIWVKNKSSRSELRNKIYLKIIQEANNHDIEVVKPARFGNGQYMTVAVLKNEYRVTNSENIIDMARTVENIRKIEKILEGIKE